MKLQPHAAQLTGLRIGQLVVVEPVRRGRRGVIWRCICTCGNNSYEAYSGDLRSGRIRSCGCYRNSEDFALAHVVHGHRRQNKGETSRTYQAWCEMKKRCDNPTAQNYPWYGGKGIKYDSRWADFNWFLAFMGECPEGYELSRKDHTKNYEPGNAQWVEASIHAHEKKPRTVTSLS